MNGPLQTAKLQNYINTIQVKEAACRSETHERESNREKLLASQSLRIFTSWKACWENLASLVKVARFLVVITCSVAFCFQFLQCLQKYKNPPVSTHTSVVFNDSIWYPALTVCREIGYIRDVVEAHNLTFKTNTLSNWKRFPWKQTTLEEFWNRATYPFESVVLQASLAGKRKGSIRQKTWYNFEYGRCVTFKPLYAVSSLSIQGYLLKFKETGRHWEYNRRNNISSRWVVFIHEAEEDLAENSLFPWNVPYLTVSTEEEVTAQLRLTEVVKLPHPSRPCEPDGSYSRMKCIDSCGWKNLTSAVTCRAPWKPDLPLPHCDNAKDFVKLLQVYMDFKDYTQNCTCLSACTMKLFSVAVMDRTKSSGTLKSILTLVYDSHLNQRLLERWSYDGSQFLADIGGSLGFFLGISIINSVAYLEALVVLFRTAARRK